MTGARIFSGPRLHYMGTIGGKRKNLVELILHCDLYPGVTRFAVVENW